MGLTVLAVATHCPADADFVGSQTCSGCHEAEFEAWSSSHHDLAMQHATPETVLGDFDDAEITVYGVTSRFFVRDAKFFVRTDGANGALADFEITYTFGVDPLQQYLVPFPDGRVQALSLAWDSRPASKGGQRWLHLYPGERVDHEDELHWTGRQQNWNYMCADCHSTNLVKGYDIESDRFATTWSEIDVACEACHGPGREHVEWAASDSERQAEMADKGFGILLRDRLGVSWRMDPETGIAGRSEPPNSRVEVGVCAVCHSRRGTLAGGAQGDPDFLDHHRPAFLTEPLYFPDGQIQDEVYVWGSFVQSQMYAAGVTCSDCHDPHSLELRAQGDAVCAQCHLPSKFAVTAHHGHPAQPGAPACVDCHMPERTYMVVDPRRDHSMRVPRPDLSLTFGVPNACSQCHADKTAAWAADSFEHMFPEAGRPSQDWTSAFSQARAGLPQAEVSLLRVIGDGETPAIARATAAMELAPYLSPLSGQAIQDALKDPSPLVRLASLRTLEVLPAEHRFAFAGHLLSDPLLAVRSEAGRVLAVTPPDALDAESSARLRAAIDDFIASQRYNADRPESWLNLGNLRASMGDLDQAENDYRHAVRLSADFAPGYLNLADLYRFRGDEVRAASVLEAGLLQQPRDAALHHALGLAKVRGGDQEGALKSLGRATELAPEEARYAYVYGVGLNSAGQAGAAVRVLTGAHQRHPNDIQIMQTLALIERDRGNLEQARHWAGMVLAVNPADQGARQLLQSLGGGSR